MRIIHCADLHLDSKLTANFPTEKAAERRAEMLRTFQQMLSYAVENEVEAILIAGDLFDRKRISAGARNVVKAAIETHPQITFYYLAGNHDADSFFATLEEIPANLKLFGDTWTSYTANRRGAGNIVITGMELHADNAPGMYHSLVLDQDVYNIVMLHGQDGEYQSKEKAEQISIKEFRHKGIDYLALGHIHSFREKEIDARGIYCYPGCLEGRGFDECGEHGFVLLDIDEKTKKCERYFVPSGGRSIYTVEVDITGCMNTPQISRRIQETLLNAEYSQDSLMKIVLCGHVDVECEKNLELLTAQFADHFYYVKIKDESALQVDYQAFALEASLKGEFVRTVMAAADIPEEEKTAIVRYGIRALAGEEVCS